MTTGQQTAKLLPDDSVEEHHFGRSVAIEGAQVVIAAPYDNNNGYRSGSAYLFDVGSCGDTVLVPDSYFVTRGTHASGGVAELAESDNADLSLQRAAADTQSRTEFEVKSTSPTATPSSLEFTLEGAVFARGNVVQTIELFDYVAAAWELVDTSDAARTPAPDSVVTVAATGNLSRFVEAGTMCIEARVRYLSDKNRQNFASNTDQTIWTIGQ